MLTTALILIAIGLITMLATVSYGLFKFLRRRKANPSNQTLTWAVGVIGSFLVGQLFFDAGVMFYLGYLTALVG